MISITVAAAIATMPALPPPRRTALQFNEVIVCRTVESAKTMLERHQAVGGARLLRQLEKKHGRGICSVYGHVVLMLKAEPVATATLGKETWRIHEAEMFAELSSENGIETRLPKGPGVFVAVR
jgi:hypothetical protein